MRPLLSKAEVIHGELQILIQILLTRHFFGCLIIYNFVCILIGFIYAVYEAGQNVLLAGSFILNFGLKSRFKFNRVKIPWRILLIESIQQAHTQFNVSLLIFRSGKLHGCFSRIPRISKGVQRLIQGRVERAFLKHKFKSGVNSRTENSLHIFGSFYSIYFLILIFKRTGFESFQSRIRCSHG